MRDKVNTKKKTAKEARKRNSPGRYMQLQGPAVLFIRVTSSPSVSI